MSGWEGDADILASVKARAGASSFKRSILERQPRVMKGLDLENKSEAGHGNLRDVMKLSAFHRFLTRYIQHNKNLLKTLRAASCEKVE